MNIENRTALPLASSSGCSCCSPAASAHKAPAAVGIPAAGTSDAGAPSDEAVHAAVTSAGSSRAAH
ncbi:hypothetical protein [Pseudarthrobacter sp. NS4]|uniref:hypothetical protein n=1 Tax=Pseudarthrobacter sp. NS4 TaxID=2973976 RepID=UPI00216203AC|nr:hypothetical protein [Pseudarthrobacter sp. NS4]